MKLLIHRDLEAAAVFIVGAATLLKYRASSIRLHLLKRIDDNLLRAANLVATERTRHAVRILSTNITAKTGHRQDTVLRHLVAE